MTDKLEEIRAALEDTEYDTRRLADWAEDHGDYLLRIAEAAEEARCPGCGVWSREAKPLRAALNPVGEEE